MISVVAAAHLSKIGISHSEIFLFFTEDLHLVLEKYK